MAGPKHLKSQTFLGRGLFRDVATFAELERRISGLPSQKDEGDAFEVFAEAYLATQTVCQAAQIWPFDRVPSEILRKHGLDTLRDMGVDGVYETTLGQLNAYQAKFRTDRPSLAWRELSTFMGLSEQVHQRVLLTNTDDLPALMADRKGFFCVRGSDLDRLERRDFDAIATWLESGRVIYERKKPREHQAQAIAAVTSNLASHDRATTVMACGTGKTLVALWIAEAMGVDTVLVLVPSLALVRQTLHEWVKETHWKAFAFLCVCSDPSVARADDDVVVRQADLDFPVTTDSTTVRAFLGSHSGVRAVFSTYQSAEVVAQGMPPGFRFDLGIFDEAHKTAAREGTKFSFALRNENMPLRKRLFMTATPRHYDIRKKDKEGDAQLVYSMDAEDTYGIRAFTLSFGEAAKRDIICRYKVVISVATTEMVNEERRRRGEVIVEGDVVKAQQVANQIAVQKAVEQYGIRKAFTFHRSVKSAKSFVAEGGEGIGAHIPSFATFHVNGDMPTSVRDGFIKGFRDADRAIITNARCLTEGVDVPAVDMVAFLSPRKSKVDIVQATGRAMRKSDQTSKTHGYVLVPLYLEQHENETIEEALRRSDFGDVWNVLQAMQEQDEELAEIIRQLREERGRTKGFDDSRLRERVEVLGPEVALAELRHGISTALIDRLGTNWHEMYGLLVAFRSREGHCRVPRRHQESGFNLGSWVHHQRVHGNALGPDRRAPLDALGFVWDVLADDWETGFRYLQAFKDREGHCRVRHRYTENDFSLGSWVQNQRKQINAHGPDRRARLDALGFVWDSYADGWENGFLCLQAFKDREGHCRVPQSHLENGFKLGIWVSNLRMKQDALGPDRRERLESLGFVWDHYADEWETGFRHLQTFKDREEHCRVPSNHRENGFKLGGWVSEQRKQRNALGPDRRARLDALGFVWDALADDWETGFRYLQAFKDREGHCRVQHRHVEDGFNLGTWAFTQRGGKDTLSEDRRARLDALGFVWDSFADRWENGFRCLQAFTDREGHCRVPLVHVEDGLRLGQWVGVQRRRKGTLGQERRSRLDALGFLWGVLADDWETGFRYLQAFKDREGHCRVQHRHVEDGFNLGTWAFTQRGGKDTLSEDRRARLDALGFVWDASPDAWETGVRYLQVFKDREGHCRVPQRHIEDGFRLGQWVGVQRGGKDTLSEDRRARLDALGFVWDALSDAWERGLRYLQTFKDREGHCRVPLVHVEDGFRLGPWVGVQRGRKDTLGPERRSRLDALGFLWDVLADDWENAYRCLQAFKDREGHCRVLQRDVENGFNLGGWVSEQRRNRERMSAERKRRLNQLGFEWHRLTRRPSKSDS